MPVHTFPLGPLETNCYIVERDGCALAVDPGGDPTQALNLLKERKLSLQAILVTHMHFDHLYGVAAMGEAAGATIMTPPGDAYLEESGASDGGMWGFPKVTPFTAAPLAAGEHRFGPLTCTAMLTPGHTRGSVSLYFPLENAVFTGDLLFYRAVGRSDLPGGDAAALLRSIQENIFTLPGQTVVYPGHGPATTVEDEKNNNPYCGTFARKTL